MSEHYQILSYRSILFSVEMHDVTSDAGRQRYKRRSTVVTHAVGENCQEIIFKLYVSDSSSSHPNWRAHLMIMTRRCMLTAMATMILLLVSGTGNAQDSLDSMLKTYLSRYDLPAIAAAVVREGKVISAGAVGTRRVGNDIPVTLNDRFHKTYGLKSNWR